MGLGSERRAQERRGWAPGVALVMVFASGVMVGHFGTDRWSIVSIGLLVGAWKVWEMAQEDGS